VALCTECKVLVELTEPRLIVFLPGVNGYDGEACVEVPGWDEYGTIHHANNPKPLTPAAKEFLAIAAKAGAQ